MRAPTTKQQLIAEIQQEHAQWQALLSEIGTERMEEPGVTGDWTMKDTLAHLTTWWRREIALVEAMLRGERPPDHPPQHPDVQIINHWVYLTNRDRPLQDVLRDAEDAWQRFEAAVKRVPEDWLFDPTRFAWMNGRELGPSILDDFVNHHVIVATPYGTVRGRVVSVKRMGTGVGTVVDKTVDTVDVLPSEDYQINSVTDAQSSPNPYRWFACPGEGHAASISASGGRNWDRPAYIHFPPTSTFDTYTSLTYIRLLVDIPSQKEF